MICSSSRFIIQFRKLQFTLGEGHSLKNIVVCLSCKHPLLGQHLDQSTGLEAAPSDPSDHSHVLVQGLNNCASHPALLCSALADRTSLPQSAELCSSPLSQGLHCLHHSDHCLQFSDQKEWCSEVHLQAFSACNIYLGMCTVLSILWYFFQIIFTAYSPL